MVFRIVLALLCGLSITALILQQDESIKDLAGNYCTSMFETALDCNVQLQVKNINLFALTIELKNITASSKDNNDWQWHCKQYRMRFSPQELLYSNTIGIHMYLEGVTASSALHSTHLDIVPHIAYLISDVAFTVPVTLKSIIFHRATLTANDAANGNMFDVTWDSVHKWLHDRFQSTFYITHGISALKNIEYCTDVMGTVELVSKKSGEDIFTCTTNLYWKVPQLPDERNIWFCTGTFVNNFGEWNIRNIDDTCTINPFTLKTSNDAFTINADAIIPINYYLALIKNEKASSLINGTSRVSLRAEIGNTPHAECTCHLDTVTYNAIPLCTSSDISATYTDGVIHGTIDSKRDNAHINGSWQWTTSTNNSSLDISANNNISLNPLLPWTLQENSSHATIACDANAHITGKYHAIGEHKDQLSRIDGTFSFTYPDISINGTIDEQSYAADLVLSPTPRIKKIHIKNDQKTVVSCKGYAPSYERFKSTIDLDFIKSLVENYSTYELHGTGAVTLFGILKPEKISLKAHLENGTLRIPHIYNIVNGLDAVGSLDLHHHILTLNSVECSLYEGCCNSHNAVIRFDNDWQPYFTLIPLTLNNCLINVNKDLFTNISGHLLLSYEHEKTPTMNGFLSLTRSHLTENLFSGELHERLMRYTKTSFAPHGIDPQVDIKIITQHPIHIRTSFLDGQALGSMHLSGFLHEPKTVGSIKLSSGSLCFPYKPLFISKGSIVVDPQQLDDPFIELIAKNKIKRYMITLSVTGSLKHHNIHLEASPPLRDEQIIALLFAGSEEESLSTIAPALVLQNIKSLIFGAHASSLFHKYFGKALKPLKYVHFVPSFSDQTGRGGLRGTIEVDINDRWRAAIQKNFDLFEDTRFELEYILSDDISLKGIRDEHRDISGEVEMRWKF